MGGERERERGKIVALGTLGWLGGLWTKAILKEPEVKDGETKTQAKTWSKYEKIHISRSIYLWNDVKCYEPGVVLVYGRIR